jgi:2-polyprenyl-6-methoxyphenol hydroxylase-like FAD-dependent oxidoreductase
MKTTNGRAVVLGGSIAGVLAARVLAESYGDVLVIDRDALVGVSESRRGTPHTRHAHGLHARGHLIMEELFPGLTSELTSAGIPSGDLGEMAWYFNARRIQPARTGLTSITAPRPVLEEHIRAKVAAMTNVRILEQHSILDLLATADRERIVGVRVQGAESHRPEIVEADLVIDATGRGSRTPVWLEQLGYRRPDEDRMKIDLAYTTRLYRLRSEMFDGIQSINPVASPENRRGAFFGQIGRDVCILSLTGMLGDYPPTDPEAFLDFVRTLPAPEIYEAVRDAEPLDVPTRFRFPASVRRRYERLSRFPEGLIVVGDAVCSFNPVYGQGMSVAALEAVLLRKHLQSPASVRAGEFQVELAKVVDDPWKISTGGDLDFPGVEGRRTPTVRLGNAYLSHLHYAATKDAKITEAFMRVAGLVDGPGALMHPRVALRVLWQIIRRRIRPRLGSNPSGPALHVESSESRT